MIGAGLPLLQRLLLLKAKESREAASSSSIVKETLTPPVPTTISSKESSISPTPTTPSVIDEKHSMSDTTFTPSPKPCTNNHSTKATVFNFNNTSTSATSSTSLVVPSISKVTKPWSKLKKAAILNETNLNLSVELTKISPTFSRVPDIISDNKTSALDKRDIGYSCDNNSDSDCDFNRRTKMIFEKKIAMASTKPTIQQIPAYYPARKRKPCMLHVRTKNYVSVDDLSPEYCGLPFVKKLKILNERQKLAELESVVKTRSASLDYPDTITIDMQDTLTRSHSEACAIHSRGTSLCVPMDQYPPLSPESNETPERRSLKSILKKLSEDPTAASTNAPEIRRLMRAPTIEGYAARHSKLSKSVTFNRDTLQSPPQQDLTLIPTHRPHILFPLSNNSRIAASTQTDDCLDNFSLATKNQVKFLHGMRSIFSSESTVIPGPLDEVVVGSIKQVIQCHLQEMQTKFQSLELEIKRRDDVISQLQSRIQELERLSATIVSTTTSAATVTTPTMEMSVFIDREPVAGGRDNNSSRSSVSFKNFNTALINTTLDPTGVDTIPALGSEKLSHY